MRRCGGPFTTTSARFCVSMSRTRCLRSCTRPLRSRSSAKRRRNHKFSGVGKMYQSPAHPGSFVSSEEYRLALCERCRVQLRLCGRCDRGQRLCSACRPVRRRESLHRASAAYRVKPRARRLQSVRQARPRSSPGQLRGEESDASHGDASRVIADVISPCFNDDPRPRARQPIRPTQMRPALGPRPRPARAVSSPTERGRDDARR